MHFYAKNCTISKEKRRFFNKTAIFHKYILLKIGKLVNRYFAKFDIFLKIFAKLTFFKEEGHVAAAVWRVDCFAADKKALEICPQA